MAVEEDFFPMTQGGVGRGWGMMEDGGELLTRKGFGHEQGLFGLSA